MVVESPEAEEDALTESSVGSMPQSQCTPDEADSEDEFEDAVEPPSSTSGVLVAFDGAAPPLSGVYEDALEATEQQVAAALESTNSDGSGSTIQEEDEEEEEDVETETAEIEAEVAAAVEEIVELATRGGVNISAACSDEVVELIKEDVNAQAPDDPVEQEDQSDTVEDAEKDAIVEQDAEELESSQEALEQEGAADGPAPNERNTSDETTFEESVGPSDDNEEADTTDTPVVSEAPGAEQVSTADVVEDVSGVISSVDAVEVVEQDAMDCVEKTDNTDNEPSGDVEDTSKKEVQVADVVAAGEANDGLVHEAHDTTVANAEVALKTPEVDRTSEEVSIETATQHSSSRIDAVVESEESAQEKATDEEQVAEPAPEEKITDELVDDAVDEVEKVVAIKDGSHDEPVAEEVDIDESNTSADEQVMPLKSTANPDENVTEAADEDSVDGTEREPSQPKEFVNTVHEADAKEIIPQAANDPVDAVQAEVEENQQADLDSSEVASGNTDEKPERCDAELVATPEGINTVITEAAAPEQNPAEEEPEAPPAFQGAPTSSSRKSSDHDHEHEHGRNLAAVSLLPRLAPSSETTTTTTTTTIEPFILSSESNEMLEGHFPPQRFTYEVFGFSIDKRVVYYHVHRSDRRTGVREPAILKRYTDFQTQPLDSCLRVAADMPRIPKPHLGTVLRGYKSKRTIEVRERAFRALLRYIAQYPALHGSAIFERFITTSRATSGPGWM